MNRVSKKANKGSSEIRVRPSNVRESPQQGQQAPQRDQGQQGQQRDQGQTQQRQRAHGRDSRHRSVNRVSKKASKGSSRVKRVAATFR